MGNLSVGRCLKHVVEAPREGLRFRLFLVLVSLPCLARAGHLAPLLLLPIVFCLLDLFLFRCFAVFLVVAQCVCVCVAQRPSLQAFCSSCTLFYPCVIVPGYVSSSSPISPRALLTPQAAAAPIWRRDTRLACNKGVPLIKGELRVIAATSSCYARLFS